MSLNEFLVWLTAGGAVAAVAWLAERWPWFVALPSAAKRPIMAIVAVALACAARAVTVYVPADVLAQVAPWFEMIYSILALYAVNQATHKADPGRNAGKQEPPQ